MLKNLIIIVIIIIINLIIISIINNLFFGNKDNADNEIWKIGVDKPSEEINAQDRFQFILELNNKSLATSGNYRKFYIEDGVKYSHVINPFNGFPAKNRLLSVTVIHDDCMYADAYATAFMVMGLKQSKIFLEENNDFYKKPAVIIAKDIGPTLCNRKNINVKNIVYKKIDDHDVCFIF